MFGRSCEVKLVRVTSVGVEVLLVVVIMSICSLGLHVFDPCAHCASVRRQYQHEAEKTPQVTESGSMEEGGFMRSESESLNRWT